MSVEEMMEWIESEDYQKRGKIVESFLKMSKEEFKKDERLLSTLILLLCDGNKTVRKRAENIIKKQDYPLPVKIYIDLSEVDKKKLQEKIVHYSRSLILYKMWTAINFLKLIPKGELDNDLKIALILSMCNWTGGVKEAAKEIAKQHGYSSVSKIYRDLSGEGKWKLKEEIKSYSKTMRWATVNLLKLIPKGELDNDLKIALIFTMHGWKLRVRVAAKEIAKQHGYSSVSKIYRDLSGEGKWKLKEEIKKYCKSSRWGERHVAIDTLVALDLIEFIDRVVDLCDDPNSRVVKRATKAVEDLVDNAVLGKVETAIDEGVGKKISNIVKRKYDSNNTRDRLVAAELLRTKGLWSEMPDEDLEVATILLMCDENKVVRKKIKRPYSLMPWVRYKKLNEKGKKKLVERIKTYCKGDVWEKKCIAIEAIVALKLIDLTDEVFGLCNDRNEVVRKKVLVAIEKLGKKVVAGKVVAKEEDIEKLTTFFSKSNNPNHKALAEQLIFLRYKHKSTEIDYKDVFGRRVEKKEETKRKLEDSEPKRQ